MFVVEDIIAIQLDHYPISDHEQFLQKLAKRIENSTDIRVTDFQYLGDSCGCCLVFEDTIFILHVNELAECTWIEPTIKCCEQLIRLKNRLSLIVSCPFL